MTLTSTPLTAGTPVAGWLLPTPGDAQIRLERVVMRANATDEGVPARSGRLVPSHGGLSSRRSRRNCGWS